MPRPSSRPERAVIVAALDAEDGSITRAAGRLRTSRRSLHRWLQELGIKVTREVVETADS